MSNADYCRSKSEYGGFLPLELRNGQEYYGTYETISMKLNSVKSAIRILQDQIRWKKIYIPYYYCPSTARTILEISENVVYYHINSLFEPQSLQDEDNAAVLLVNYFGVNDELISAYAGRFKRSTVIIDNAHSFFCRPVIGDNVYCLYSAKKFFGVFDGAYVIGKNLQKRELPIQEAGENAAFLLSSYEKGTNYAYAQKKYVDGIIAGSCAGMSVLTQGILKNTDYEAVKESRYKNTDYLRKKLEEQNEVKTAAGSIPYLFPYLPKTGGKELKEYLVSKKIYVPTLWAGENLLNNGNSFELRLSREGVFLPVDQRYDICDMEFIVNTIGETINDNT